MNDRSEIHDVFLCHSSVDKLAVEQIARRLKEEGLKPWLDKWNLIPGDPWQPEIEKALECCRTCAVFIGKRSDAPWQNEEMRAAIARRVTDSSRSFRVIPVLLPKTKRSKTHALPAFLAAGTWVEFSSDLTDPDAFHRLVCGIRGVQPGERTGDSTPIRTQWVLVLKATVEDIDRPTAEAMLKHLADLSGDATLVIKKIRQGSVRITFEGTSAGCERILSLRELGELNRLLEFDVLEVYPLPESDDPLGRSDNNKAVDSPDTSIYSRPILSTKREPDQRRNKSDIARTWLRSFAATGTGIAIGSLVPGSSSESLLTLSVTLCYHIGKIYKGESYSWNDARTAAQGINVAAVATKIAGLKILTFVPVIGWAAKEGVATAVLNLLGEATISYYEHLETQTSDGPEPTK